MIGVHLSRVVGTATGAWMSSARPRSRAIGDRVHERLSNLVKTTVEDITSREAIVRRLGSLGETMKEELSSTPAGYLSGCYCEGLVGNPAALRAFAEEVSA